MGRLSLCVLVYMSVVAVVLSDTAAAPAAAAAVPAAPAAAGVPAAPVAAGAPAPPAAAAVPAQPPNVRYEFGLFLHYYYIIYYLCGLLRIYVPVTKSQKDKAYSFTQSIRLSFKLFTP